jgi:hypothetical protein
VPEGIPSKSSLLVHAASADIVENALHEGALEYERAGAPRGIASAVELFIVATPSAAALLLLLEKLRRLRLPRTYVALRDDEVEIWTDQVLNDGRFFVVRGDDRLEESPDTGLSAKSLKDLLRGDDAGT